MRYLAIPLLIMLFSVSMVSAEEITKGGYIVPPTKGPINVYGSNGNTWASDIHGNTVHSITTSDGVTTYHGSNGQHGTIYDSRNEYQAPQLNSPAPPRQLQPCPPGSYQRFC